MISFSKYALSNIFDQSGKSTQAETRVAMARTWEG